MKSGRGHKKLLAIALVGIALIATVALVVFLNPFSMNHNGASSSFSPLPTQTITAAPTASPNAQTQQDLVNYALSLINADRQANGLQNVTLSSEPSGQEHAEDMLKNGYFSHWGLNGYKPYLRYTLAGGQGAVDENIAWQEQTGGGCIDVESALKTSEWNMMYNDSASNWGHKDNILDPLHNKVSIGIAYDSNNVYFVEDFENDYISWSQLSVNNNEVSMAGVLTGQESTSQIQQISVYYDNPTPLTVNQIKQAPYNGGYDAGSFVGLALTGNYQSQSGITIPADNWSQNGTSFQISFSLSKAIAVDGNGVYTLYLQTGSSTADSLLTYSIWIN